VNERNVIQRRTNCGQRLFNLDQYAYKLTVNLDRE
jgi:hypothetical protein